MFISRVSLENYRNYRLLKTEFGNRLNVIFGPNASGKTNLIEAIYYLSLARSFKKASDRDLIRLNSKEARIILEYQSEIDGRHSIEAEIMPEGKIISLDQEKQKSVSKIVGKLLTVVYSPSSVSLFRGEPMERRRFIDTTLSLLSDKYLYALTRQKKLLKERNTALSLNYDEDVISVLTSELINVSYRIFMDRKAFLAKADLLISPIYQKLFGETEKLEIRYSTNMPDADSQERFVELCQKKFSAIKTEERLRKMTLLGPHRDDLIAELNSNSVYAYASQGQNRLVVLALVLSAYQIIGEHFKEKPILLLDDVLSDLDQVRKEKLIDYLQSLGQVFITTSEEDLDKKDIDKFEIKNGNIERRI